jgi:hypothetical protein
MTVCTLLRLIFKTTASKRESYQGDEFFPPNWAGKFCQELATLVTTPETVCGGGASLEQRRLDRVHGEVVDIRRQGRGGRG